MSPRPVPGASVCLICREPFTRGTWGLVTLDRGERVGVHHACHDRVLTAAARKLAERQPRR